MEIVYIIITLLIFAGQLTLTLFLCMLLGATDTNRGRSRARQPESRRTWC